MFSLTCEHAIKEVIFVARQSLDGQRTNLKEIAAGIESPVAYTAKILQQLVKSNFVLSTKGVNGGFETDLNKMKSLPLMRIVEVFDGDFIANRCVLGLKSCNSTHPCPLHEKYAPVRGRLVSVLESTCMLDLALGIYSGQAILKEL
ncbi:MAG: Rrf2 family transcriptional regulator [Saprospiraceae bacterium]|nr:Rrf2 family transcriptional regulator [Saprospiraceae bacterium]